MLVTGPYTRRFGASPTNTAHIPADSAAKDRMRKMWRLNLLFCELTQHDLLLRMPCVVQNSEIVDVQATNVGVTP